MDYCYRYSVIVKKITSYNYYNKHLTALQLLILLPFPATTSHRSYHTLFIINFKDLFFLQNNKNKIDKLPAMSTMVKIFSFHFPLSYTASQPQICYISALWD